MNREIVTRKIDRVLAALDAQEIEERIAPVKCWKDPDHPDCNPQPEPAYGIDPPIEALYGIEIDE